MSNGEDPFFGVKEEVQQSLRACEAMYQRWKMLLQQGGNSEEYRATMSDLTKNLKSIEWDIDDLEETVTLVESNPSRFNISTAELASRRQFITKTRNHVKDIHNHLQNAQADAHRGQRRDLFSAPASNINSSSSTSNNNNNNYNSNNNSSSSGGNNNSSSSNNGSRTGGGNNITGGNGKQVPTSSSFTGKTQYNRYAKLEAEVEESNNAFIQSEHQKQMSLMKDQDHTLTQIQTGLTTLKQMGQEIELELDAQDEMLDDLGNDLENTGSKLSQIIKKVDKVLDASNDKKQMCIIVFLLLVLLVLIILFVAL